MRCPPGFVTETDLDVGNLALKHDLAPAVITDVLQLLQKVTSRSKSRSIDEPFALNFKALRIRTDVVQGLAGKVGGNKSKPTTLSVGRAHMDALAPVWSGREAGSTLCTYTCRRSLARRPQCGDNVLHTPVQTEALLRREKQLRMELATSQRNAQQQSLTLAQYQQQVSGPQPSLPPID